jgi:hypothetical protein
VNRPAVRVLGPHRASVSGVSTHVNTLLASGLADDFSLIHFQVGSEGRTQMGIACRGRIAASYSVERPAGDVRRVYADLFAGKHADALH